MSRSLASGSTKLTITPSSTWTIGSTERSIFGWIKLTNFSDGSTQKIAGFGTSSTAEKSYVFTGGTNDTFTWNNGGDAFVPITMAAGLYDGAWVPFCLACKTTSNNFIDFYLGDTLTSSRPAAPVANTFETMFLGSSSLPRTFAVSHLTYYDNYVTSANYSTLITEVDGKAPNPTTVNNSNILSYWAFETDTLVAQDGSDQQTFTGSGSSFVPSDQPDVDPFASSSIQPNMDYYLNMMRG